MAARRKDIADPNLLARVTGRERSLVPGYFSGPSPSHAMTQTALDDAFAEVMGRYPATMKRLAE